MPASEPRTTREHAVPFKLSDVDWNQSGADQNAEAAAEGLSLNRIEDGAWDPSNPNDYYFVTTTGGEGTGDGGGGGLWKLSYTDIENPSLGGTLTLLLDGTEPVHGGTGALAQHARQHRHRCQREPAHPGGSGASDSVAGVLAYRIADGALGQVATFDPNLFGAGSPNQITNDEESSGIIDATDTFGPGNWLLDAQVHTADGLPPGEGEGTVEELVEKGQLIRMDVTDWSAVYRLPPTLTSATGHAPWPSQGAVPSADLVVWRGHGSVAEGECFDRTHGHRLGRRSRNHAL